MDVIEYKIIKNKDLDNAHTVYFNGQEIGYITEIQFSRESKYLFKFLDRKRFPSNYRGKYYKSFDSIASNIFQMILLKSLVEEERNDQHTDQLEVAKVQTR
jgi:hypothetical protein